jgi:hypothetical protein
MSTISGNGATEAIYLQMSGNDVQYSVGTPLTWTTINSGEWPVTITNTAASPGPSTILRVVFTQNLTMSSNTDGILGYFIAGSTYITLDGSGNTIIIDNIALYPGFIQNGTQTESAYANIVVQNINTGSVGSVSLEDYSGWICQDYFGKGVSGTSVINCENTLPIASFRGGGIIGPYYGYGSGSLASITNCTNTGTITGSGAGGVVGYICGAEGGLITITGCTNTGLIIGDDAGGIAGTNLVQGANSSATITNCENTGAITGSNSGGIIGSYGGVLGTNSLVILTNCTNTGVISGNSAGGIAGGNLAGNGIATITNCTNTGNINGTDSGGIIGSEPCNNNGVVTITKCFSTGLINGISSGGITGNRFAFNTDKTCVISQCYSTGDISGELAGGITGSDVGLNNNDASYNPVADIVNCYSLGAISTTCGGICGGWNIVPYNNKPTIQITNSYSYGTLVDANSGLVAVSLTSTQINLTTLNTYVAAGTWSDATANASGALLGYPTDVNTNNPGSTWASISPDTPYVLSSYNAVIYNPGGASSRYNYTSNPGLFQPDYNYTLVYTSQYYEEATAHVFVSKGTYPKYYSYNFNRFNIVNETGSENPIIISINSSNGELNFIMPFPCFLEGTKILCFENNQEVYRPIESLRKGDLVKTIYNGYMPIYLIGTSPIYNPGNDYRITNRLYKCPKEKYPGLIEDLYITGCHSILVPSMTDDQWENTKAVHKEIYITDNHFRLIACADEKAEPYNKEGFMNIYHIALEHDDYYMNYGIYANGLLVESCSKRYLMEVSKMTLLGEEDCAISEEVHIDGGASNIIRQLVDTY